MTGSCMCGLRGCLVCDPVAVFDAWHALRAPLRPPQPDEPPYGIRDARYERTLASCQDQIARLAQERDQERTRADIAERSCIEEARRNGALTLELAEAREVLTRVGHWTDHRRERWCRECAGHETEHDTDCRLAAVLSDFRGCFLDAPGLSARDGVARDIPHSYGVSCRGEMLRREDDTMMTLDRYGMTPSKFSRDAFDGDEAAAHAALLAHESALIAGAKVRVYRGTNEGMVGVVDGESDGRAYRVRTDDGLAFSIESRNLELV